MNFIFESIRCIVRLYFHTFFNILGLLHSTFFIRHAIYSAQHGCSRPRADSARDRSLFPIFICPSCFFSHCFVIEHRESAILFYFKMLSIAFPLFSPIFSFFSFSSRSPMTVGCFPLFSFNYY